MKKTQVRIRLLPRMGLLAAVSLGLVASVAAGPASAVTATTVPPAGLSYGSARSYVALGDSFTGGQGAPPYLPGPCLKSKFAAYPTIAAALSPYRLTANKACSGAAVADVQAQLAGVSPDTALVTLTVGGIDAGSNAVLAACAPDPTAPSCEQAVGASSAQLAVLGPRLAGLYGQIAAALPNARIVVMNYPRLFNPGVLPLADLVNASTDALDAVIGGAVAATGNARVQLVDVTQEFAGHGIGARVPYISLNPTDPLAPANIHPNALGNTLGYARALATDGVLRR
jgi:lysophospholipase L1-like esterase